MPRHEPITMSVTRDGQQHTTIIIEREAHEKVSN
jgi:hypothetical protein